MRMFLPVLLAILSVNSDSLTHRLVQEFHLHLDMLENSTSLDSSFLETFFISDFIVRQSVQLCYLPQDDMDLM